MPRRAHWVFPLAVSVLSLVMLSAGAQDKQDKPKPNTAIKPSPRMTQQPDPNWLKRHESFCALAKKGDIDVLFLGDSITDAWRGKPQQPIWEKYFAPLKAANFGIGGDRTQHVLWRIQHGELEGIQPKVVMLMIGTNNSNGKDNTAEEIADGITSIVKEIQKRLPSTKILLLGVFPRGEKPNPQREKIAQVNEIIAKLDDGKTVKYLDIGKVFLEADGTIRPEVMPDFLHLSTEGYQRWADAVKEPILSLLNGK
jgi:lysophospholipase L1-like esterase